jgi:surfactin synthase thioesterase subunit
MPVVGDPSTAKYRLVLFNDAGGDPANFRSWAATWTLGDVAILAVHWPGHTTRASEPPCVDLNHASAIFIREALPYLQDRPYAFLGQCIGAYFAYRITTAIAQAGTLRTPSALIAVACPGPTQMEVLTTFTEHPPGALATDSDEQRLVRGLHALTLAIGFTEEDWRRLQSDAKLFKALKCDVAMTDVPPSDHALTALPCAMFAVLGAVDPVVKRKHILSWLDIASDFRHVTLPALGHNIQYEAALTQAVAGYLPSKFMSK